MHDSRTCFEAVEPTISFGRLVIERGVVVEYVEHRKLVAPSNLVIVEVVSGRNLHAARAELRVHVFICDDRNRATRQGEVDGLTYERTITLIVGVHCNSRVAEHRFRSRRRDNDVAAAIRQRVPETPELALLLASKHF